MEKASSPTQPLKQVTLLDPLPTQVRSKPRFETKVLALVRWLLRTLYKLKPNAFVIVTLFGAISFGIIAMILNLSFKQVVNVDPEEVLSHPIVTALVQELRWFSWWIVLGIASSIGLGTGLHTFILFLGPWIAKVTMTAYSLKSLDFNDHGPNAFQPNSPNLAEPALQFRDTTEVTLLTVFAKVYLVCYLWGFGTAIGELPPYFISRAAAIAGQDDPEIETIDTILSKPAETRTQIERVQVFIYNLLQQYGFYGILLCAAVPNPFFDLAGMMCGSFGVPFYTFFGATVVGKAVIKTSFQSFMVVVLFSEGSLEWGLEQLRTWVPAVYSVVEELIRGHVKKFRDGGVATTEQGSDVIALLIGTLWNMMLIGMVGYFVVSLLDALALQELRRDTELARALEEEEELRNMVLRRRVSRYYERRKSWVDVSDTFVKES